MLMMFGEMWPELDDSLLFSTADVSKTSVESCSWMLLLFSFKDINSGSS